MHIQQPDAILRFVLAFGSPAGQHFGHMVLAEGGRILGYGHLREQSWGQPEPGVLCFYDGAGAATSRFTEHAPGVWTGAPLDTRMHLYLVKCFEGTADPSQDAPIFVNTIPKSGTYLLEAALSRFGIPAARVHLSRRATVDDYRGLADSELHVSPERYRLSVPVDLAVATLRGQVAVGHVEDVPALERMQQQGTALISVRRNLRDVVVSLFRFKLNRVAATSKLDESWRSLPPEARLPAFLYFMADRDLRHICAMAEALLRRPHAVDLRFEDLMQAQITDAQTEVLNAIRPGLGDAFPALLGQSVGQGSSTFSGERTDISRLWSDEVEQIFDALGLLGLNQRLGYE